MGYENIEVSDRLGLSRPSVARGADHPSGHGQPEFPHPEGADGPLRRGRGGGAAALADPASRAAQPIQLVMDNLSSHTQKALTGRFGEEEGGALWDRFTVDRKSTRLNSSHRCISYAVFC